jgi:hypothetical protein
MLSNNTVRKIRGARITLMQTKIPDNHAHAHPKGVDKDWRIEGEFVRAPTRLAPGAWLSYGFTTRAAGDFLTDGAARRLLARVGDETGSAAALKLLHQVHGTTLLPTEALGEGQGALPESAGEGARASESPLPEGDGWVGRPPGGVFLGVRTADCLPLILWCDQARNVAVVHAGWRGAVAGICAKALRELHCPPKDVRALIGPCIGPCCFEVGAEVARIFGEDERWLAPSPNGVLYKYHLKYHLDLPRYVVEELVGAGMSRDAIGTAPYCTRCDERFFSHRGGDRGRLCAFAARRR